MDIDKNKKVPVPVLNSNLYGLGCPKKEVERISLPLEFELTIENFKPQEALVTNLEVEPSSLELYFCLSGKVRRIIQGLKKEIILDSGQTAIWFNRSSRITIEYLAGQPILGVDVRVKPGLLNVFFKSQSELNSVDFRGIIKECKEKFYCRIEEMTASMRLAIHQILYCNYQGLARQAYLNGKVLELLSHLISDLHSDLHSEKLSILRPEEQRMVHKAREILIHDLEKPPTLLNLSRMVGLNDCKLKMGFRQIFGTTIFGCLRNCRMEQAQQLLEDGEMSVTEVSYSVGYSSLSHFAKVFTRHFGIKPGSYLTEIRKKRYFSLFHPENPSTVKKNPSTVSNQ